MIGWKTLVVDDRHHGEEDHQQGGEGQGLLEGPADAVLLRDAGEGRQEDDDHQAEQPHFRRAGCSTTSRTPTTPEISLAPALGRHLQAGALGLPGQDRPGRLGQRMAIAEQAEPLQGQTGQEPRQDQRVRTPAPS